MDGWSLVFHARPIPYDQDGLQLKSQAGQVSVEVCSTVVAKDAADKLGPLFNERFDQNALVVDFLQAGRLGQKGFPILQQCHARELSEAEDVCIGLGDRLIDDIPFYPVADHSWIHY